MPQKPVFSRAPILNMAGCVPANGTVRTEDARINHLYQKANQWSEYPCMWEGLFRIACLIKNKPMEEPVTRFILDGITETDNGAFSGTFAEQICKARAAFAVFEYNTDKNILKRIALWFRYLEVEFDQFAADGHILYQPADLMELLVRYYTITGMKSVLRICTRLRAEAFDWTTALHTFQQSIPVGNNAETFSEMHISSRPEELEYDEREKLINHAELLADGMRYTIYSGLFSGHSQDLSSGRVLWEYLIRHHRAICGGTTAGPFLSGTASDKPVSNRALAAWTEAFGAQLILPESEWALDELIRIVNNGLEDCLEREEIPEFQRINTACDVQDISEKPELLYSRITRAVSAAYKYAVMLTESGIRINYLLPARSLFMSGKQPVTLLTDSHSVRFQCRKTFTATVDLYVSRTGTSDVILIRNGEKTVRKQNDNTLKKGVYFRTETEWCNDDGYALELNEGIISEETHHQGCCFIADNHILTAGTTADQYAYAVISVPKYEDGQYMITVNETAKWKKTGEQPADIPVLPTVTEIPIIKKMIPYHKNRCRIAMFPKAGNACLK